MKKKKQSFSLIEVLIAIVLVSTAALFLLSFENRLVAKTKESVQKLERERSIQQASVRLFELLYKQQIDWKTIAEEKSYETRLESGDWVVKYDFAHIRKTKAVLPDGLYVTATISLKKGAHEISDAVKLPFFIQREAGGDTIAIPS